MWREIRPLAMAVVLSAAATSATAQVHYEAQPRPIVIANQETWFQLGEPITFDGSFYHPAGPQVYFNANTMVRTGSYRGVPLYADATIEPFSRVFVPLSGGLMQPYERRRSGELAGSTGSQAPSYPVTIAAEAARTDAGRTPQGAAPPVFGDAPELARDRQMADESARARRTAAAQAASGQPSDVAGTSGFALPQPRRVLVQAGAKPRGLNEIFVNYQGFRWRSAGMAVELDAQEFEVVGEYRGYPVYAERGAGRDPRRIYLPSRPGLVAPYQKAGKPITY